MQKSHRVSSPDFYQSQELHTNVYRGLRGVTSSSGQGVHWKDWCWSWNSSTLVTWCEELTHLKRPWCWERLKARREVDDRGWDGWMASLTQRTWVWVCSGNWWWTERTGLLQSIGLQRVEHDWVTELNWMFKNVRIKCFLHFAMWMLQMRLVVFKNLCFMMVCLLRSCALYYITDSLQCRWVLGPDEKS